LYYKYDMSMVTMTSGDLAVEIDPDYGGDIVGFWSLRSGMQFLHSTPWSDRARAVRSGRIRSTSVDAVSRWIEHYPGGWQAICPNPGAPRSLNGTELGFHASAAAATWVVEDVAPDRVHLTTELFDAPLRIARHLALADGTVTWLDRVTNVGAAEIAFDYAGHPAFGGALLEGDARVVGRPRRLVLVDGDGTHEAGSELFDPLDDDGIATVRAAEVASRRFGWLDGFEHGELEVVSAKARAVLTWDAGVLPYVWWWQECAAEPGFPWFGRGRVLALEPCSTTPTGARSAGLRLSPGESRELLLSLRIEEAA
jgi:hypothetical protein